MKRKIGYTQQNSLCNLSGDKDEMINHLISECRKLAQNEVQNQVQVGGKVIHCELCKKLQFDHTI